MTGRRIFELDLDGRKLIVETGHVAKQANGAAIIRYEDTGVLSVVAASKEPKTLPFFPLMVIYTEKMYAGGKIPGGFLKREGRPSENETLTSRLIDRPIRPLFADGVRNEIQIINTVMSGNQDHSPEMTAMFGSSLVLGISDLDFLGPIAGVIVGRVEGEYVLNPTKAQLAASDIELTVAGTFDAINMVEAGALEVNEADMLGAIMFGHKWIKKLVTFQNEIIAEVGKEIKPFTIEEVPAEITERVNTLALAELKEAVKIQEKVARNTAVDVVKEKVVAIYEDENKDLDKDDLKALIKPVKIALDKIVKEQVRRLITIDKIRPDGRRTDEIRPLESHVDIFDRTHGSALFTRGQTQALSITTIGSLSEHQIMDGIGEKSYKRFMLHYNFPAYSVGETGRYMSAGRREIGHGALGERALKVVLPDEETFPYTIRIVSEILESNGSTSQASICAGCMSLMAAGVPIKAPVAGIAMGLIKTGNDYSILSDIQGMEDHLGDMDFKVAGTANGITALQMDIKIDGLSEAILTEALTQAKIGRLHILENMVAAIATPRATVSKFAPKVKLMTISQDKIRAVIGPGGKSITNIIESCNEVKIDIEQTGRVTIMHSDQESIDKAIAMIEAIIKEAKVGEVYSGKVVRVEKFGCFVELWKGTDGLCHISKLAHERVNKTEDIVNVGDIINVKVIGIDDKGRIDLSRKALLPRPKPTTPAAKKPE